MITIGFQIMNKNDFVIKLKEMIPEAKCELNYSKDYELLIATMLSAQTTDKKVNLVTKELFSKYSLKDLATMDIKIIEEIIRPIGTYHRKAIYLQEIAKRLIKDQSGHIPNDREYIEKLPGCGHKTCNVVLSNLFNENCVAVDTHVSRVSKRLGFVSKDASVMEIEKELERLFSFTSLWELHHRMVLFGRYICTSKNPKCNQCKFESICKKKIAN